MTKYKLNSRSETSSSFPVRCGPADLREMTPLQNFYVYKVHLESLLQVVSALYFITRMQIGYGYDELYKRTEYWGPYAEHESSNYLYYGIREFSSRTLWKEAFTVPVRAISLLHTLIIFVGWDLEFAEGMRSFWPLLVVV